MSAIGSAGVSAGLLGFLGIAAIPVTLASIFVGGAGLIRLARAVRHFRQYGSSTAVVGLIGAGVLGASVISWGLAMIPQLFGIAEVPIILRSVFTFLILGSTAVVSTTVLLGIARLAVEAAWRGDDEIVASDPTP